MKKIISKSLFSVIMFSVLSACGTKETANNQDAAISVTNAASKADTAVINQLSVNEDGLDLLPGFEAWQNSEAAFALNKVISMETELKLAINKDADAETVGFSDYSLDKITQIQGCDFEEDLILDKYAVADMDQDGTPEVIVNLLSKYDNWTVVLRFYKGDVYGYGFLAREFQEPKADGRYMASLGAFDNEIVKLSFDGYSLKKNRLGYSVSNNDNTEYYISEKKVEEKEYSHFFDDYYSSDPVSWHLFSSDIRAGYTGEKLFKVDFKARTKVGSKSLDSYYSDMVNKMEFTHKSRIPARLCDMIAEAMQTGKDDEIISPLITGTELSEEELVKLTGINEEFAIYVKQLEVDVDNDGTDDLITQTYWGGSGGFSSMQLFKGDKGEYKLSNSFECFLQEFKVISYQGKNYLLMKNFDYNTKYDSGYDLYLYENGTLADAVNFFFDIADYDMNIVYENSQFRGVEQIKTTLTNKKMPRILENNDGVIYGTAELVDKSGEDYYKYSADVDNDGNFEIYNKFMWYPSNMGTVMQCMYDFNDSIVLEDLWIRLEDEVGEGRLYTFWLDEIDEKNVLYLYVGDNLDFSLYAFMLESVR